MEKERRPPTVQETDAYRKRLVEEQERLWSEIRHDLLERLGPEYQDQIATIRDPEDLAQSDLQEDIVIEAVKARKSVLEEISQALWRMERGEYGKCLDCGRWIRARRLAVEPWASRCRDCQEKMEREGRGRS